MSESEIFEILDNVYDCIYNLECIVSDIEIFHKKEYENYHKHIISYSGGHND